MGSSPSACLSFCKERLKSIFSIIETATGELVNRPSGRAAHLRRTSFRRRENLGTGRIHFARAFQSPEGGATLWAAEPKKERHLLPADVSGAHTDPHLEMVVLVFLYEVRVITITSTLPSLLNFSVPVAFFPREVCFLYDCCFWLLITLKCPPLCKIAIVFFIIE